MTVKLLFNSIPQFIDANGDPMIGGKLYSYLAGSSTLATLYTTSIGDVAQTNPIILNSRGEPANAIWGTDGVSYKLILKTVADVLVWTIDNISPINDSTSPAASEWVDSGLTATFVSATSFTLLGDQTSTFNVGRRVKSTNSSGTIYSTITASAFTALTTIIVANDSGVLDSGISAVSYGLISGTNPSVGADMVYRKGSAVASAATTNIWGIAGDYVHISGSTGPITSLGTAPFAGDRRWIIFDSTPTLTHGANLKLPGDRNIVAAANDTALVIADTTTAHRVASYVKALSLPAQFPTKAIQGLTYANNAGDATNDLDIAVGTCRDATDAVDMVLTAAITKQSDVAWAVGTGLGGLDTGAVGNSDYYIWLIERSDTGVVDALFSLSSTAPTMPTNYDYKRLIGWFKRVGGTIVAFATYEMGGGALRLAWALPTQDVNAVNALTTTRRTDAVKVPLNFSVLSHLTIAVGDAASIFVARVMCPDETDVAITGSNANISAGPAAGVNTYQAMSVLTSSAGLIAARANLATVDLYTIATDGFTWSRRN